jgi:hypothetical protein
VSLDLCVAARAFYCGVAAGNAEARQVRPDSAALQPQPFEQAQAAPLAGRLAAAVPWQPQVHPLPGQLAHWQRAVSMGFMASSFRRW